MRVPLLVLLPYDSIKVQGNRCHSFTPGETQNINVSFADLGKEVKKYMDSGSFVPDETMISLIGKEIESTESPNWLLDGE